MLLQGFEITLILAAAGFLLGFVIGIPVALAETYGSRLVRWLAIGYVELIRGTPMLVQLFIIYYALPQVDIKFDAMTAAIIGLGINSGAYQAEYFRGSIKSIPSGQMDAALSIGMDLTSRVFRHPPTIIKTRNSSMDQRDRLSCPIFFSSVFGDCGRAYSNWRYHRCADIPIRCHLLNNRHNLSRSERGHNKDNSPR